MAKIAFESEKELEDYIGIEFIQEDNTWSNTKADFTKFHSVHGLPLVADSKQRKQDYDNHLAQIDAMKRNRNEAAQDDDMPTFDAVVTDPEQNNKGT